MVSSCAQSPFKAVRVIVKAPWRVLSANSPLGCSATRSRTTARSPARPSGARPRPPATGAAASVVSDLLAPPIDVEPLLGPQPFKAVPVIVKAPRRGLSANSARGCSANDLIMAGASALEHFQLTYAELTRLLRSAKFSGGSRISKLHPLARSMSIRFRRQRSRDQAAPTSYISPSLKRS